MSAIVVGDTISEIMERMSALRGFGGNIAENIKHHLAVVKDKLSGPAKLDLSDLATREWEGRVTDLFYSVDDLSADTALVSKPSKVMSLFSACNLAWLFQLKQIEKRVLREVAPMQNVKMLPNQDAEAEGVVGDYVRKRVVKSILKKKEGHVRAVVIHGMTGMKKERAAKYVCEDERVKSGFDVLTWIDGVELKESYAEYVVDRVYHELEKEKEKSERKRFFVVLNNFQMENRGESLKLVNKLKELAAASAGSGALLVTTMRCVVADFFSGSFESAETFQLNASFKESRSLFEGIAGTIKGETRDALLDMCGGIVGAIETMARLVRSRKPTTDSDIKELKGKFVQEMLWKYYSELDLPECRLWQCFAYSLFILSSQNSVKREKLVRLWMAEGLLRHSSKEPEDLGGEFIQELLSWSILQVVENGEIGIYNARALAAVMVYNDSVRVEDVRWVSLFSGLDDSKGTTGSLFESNKNVRTFLLESTFVKKNISRPPNQVMLSWFSCDAILSACKRLRVLTLKDLGIKALPASIGDLKSLRYLDLSRNSFQKLPICVGELQHLQTLLLSHSLKLRELPDEAYHFPSLRHLEVDQCPNLMHMPAALNKLTCLRSLPHFVASDRNGLGELIRLNDLRGDLEISHLQRFKFKGPHQACYYLKDKQHLRGLTLRWNYDDQDAEINHSLKEEEQNLIMLIQLKPHHKLKRLSIVGYRGNPFADWLSSLSNVGEISLYNCPNCQSLPTLDPLLVNLKRLTLMSLDSLLFITVTDKDNGCKDLQLKRVQISDCPNLVSWWKPGTKNDTAFSAISELVVEYCPKLVSMPLFPTIDNKLVLDCSNMKPFLNTLRYNSTGSHSSPPLSKLKELTIIKVDEKQYPQQEEWLKNFTSLARLYIRDCKALKSIKGWKHLTSLESLHISNCTDVDLPSEGWQGMKILSDLVIEDMSDLKSLPEGMKHFACLDNLEIKNCPELTTLPRDFAKESPISIVLIEDCPKLASLPESMEYTIKLDIINCPLLEARNQSRSMSDLNPLHFRSLAG